MRVATPLNRALVRHGFSCRWPSNGGSLRASSIPAGRPPPFPLALDDPGSVLAVKGSLRRFAPWTAPGRSEGMTVYEGKGGMQISQ